MSAPEQQQLESRSSVKLTRNAKGDCQIEVKVYEGFDSAQFEFAKARAVEAYRELERAFYGSAAA